MQYQSCGGGLPDRVGAERGDGGVGSRHPDRFHHALGGDHAVERIAVLTGQGARAQGVRAGNLQLVEPVARDAVAPLRDDGAAGGVLPDPMPGRDLPGTGRADPNLVVRVLEQVPESAAELLRLGPCPQQHTRIEQKRHPAPSQAASSVSSSGSKNESGTAPSRSR